MGRGRKGGCGGAQCTVHNGPKLQALVYDILSRGGGKEGGGGGGAAQEVLRNTIAMHGPSLTTANKAASQCQLGEV